MKKVGICGHYGGNNEFYDGQTVKTKMITEELKKVLGEENIECVDTYGGIKKIAKKLRNFWGGRFSKNVELM